MILPILTTMDLPDIFTLDMLPEDNHRQKMLFAPDNYAQFDMNAECRFLLPVHAQHAAAE